MRLHRLAVRNWRGVEEREVHFAATGVTVVEGPNESGKSSLVEALDALIEHLDDSKKGKVAAIKPVHKDVGAEVEAEIETGPYRFTYSKRFHKKSETKLTVTTPRPENLTGREAHERALQILDETMDRGLWAALRIEQGQRVTQANLSEQKSLSAALDRAAGVARTGEAEETLYDAAQAEYSEYFTAKGAERTAPPLHPQSLARAMGCTALRIAETLALDSHEATPKWQQIADYLFHMGHDPNWRNRPSVLDQMRGWRVSPGRPRRAKIAVSTRKRSK